MDEATAEMIERAIDQMTKEELNELTKHAYRRLVELGTSESNLVGIRAKYGLNEKTNY
ncbi:hypothetical protein [uncultured Gemmiger sp.]|uniref:hypothetical protein n=1 Tax=uncultured Gemmiger sp. TaxID=1623490 RepID=UPI0025F757AA|nr:hypothetical protein [uncultured Gemmiger sp.]